MPSPDKRTNRTYTRLVLHMDGNGATKSRLAGALMVGRGDEVGLCHSVHEANASRLHDGGLFLALREAPGSFFIDVDASELFAVVINNRRLSMVMVSAAILSPRCSFSHEELSPRFARSETESAS